jgi:branched-chain amino acid transport system ATP-binding protein
MAELAVEHLSLRFGGLTVLDDVSFAVEHGELFALIGPNGAGKTTVFNLLTRFLPATRGVILYKGEDVTQTRPADIARRGIVRSFQMSAVFPNLSVLENVRVALQRKLGLSFHFWRSERTLEVLDARALELLAEVDLAGFASVLAVELPYGRKRALEIATTLALDPELMLLDEPTQGLGHEDVGRVVELIRRVARDRTVLMVEHNLSVVADLSHTITVLQRGAILAEGPYEVVSRDPRVLEAYIGTAEATA